MDSLSAQSLAAGLQSVCIDVHRFFILFTPSGPISTKKKTFKGERMEKDVFNLSVSNTEQMYLKPNNWINDSI